MKFPEQFRWANAPRGYFSKEGDRFGVFLIPGRHACGRELQVIAVGGEESGWEHVSLAIRGHQDKAPSYAECSRVKDLFWDDEETVIQVIPPKSKHRSISEVLHLWRCVDKEFPMPPPNFVAPEGGRNSREFRASNLEWTRRIKTLG